MDGTFARVARLTIDLFKDPEQCVQMEETAKTLANTIETLENQLISSLQTRNSDTIFDELPSSAETTELVALREERDQLKAEVLANRLRLSLLFAHLQPHSS